MSAMVSLELAEDISCSIFDSFTDVHTLLILQERSCLDLFDNLSSFMANVLDVVSVLELLE